MSERLMLSPQEIKQFIFLQQKSENELRSICEGLSLKTDGSHKDLIKRLTSIESSPQTNILKPQAVPLYSKKRQGPLIDAQTNFKKWRDLLFSEKNFKKFELINSKGDSYKATMRYIICTVQDVELILQNDYLSDRSDYHDLVNLLKVQSDKFELNIVNKKDTKGNSWLMLHCIPRKAA